LALQLHIPGPVELVEPHRHGHGRDEPEHRPPVVGQPREQPGSTYSTVNQATTLRAKTPTTAAPTALDAASRSLLNRSNPRSPTSRFGTRHRSIQGGTGGSSAGRSSSSWNLARGGRSGHDQRRRRLSS
jgi:hypothetical protein